MITRTLATLALTMILAACAAHDTAPARPGRMASGRGAMLGMCPMEVVGTQVVASNVEGGIALDFTTTGDVAELRRRVEHRAAVHSQMPCGGQTAPRGGGWGRNQPPASSVTETEIDGGARLVFTPHTSTEVEELRSFVRRKAADMQTGTCPWRRAP